METIYINQAWRFFPERIYCHDDFPHSWRIHHHRHIGMRGEAETSLLLLSPRVGDSRVPVLFMWLLCYLSEARRLFAPGKERKQDHLPYRNAKVLNISFWPKKNATAQSWGSNLQTYNRKKSQSDALPIEPLGWLGWATCTYIYLSHSDAFPVPLGVHCTPGHTASVTFLQGPHRCRCPLRCWQRQSAPESPAPRQHWNQNPVT